MTTTAFTSTQSLREPAEGRVAAPAVRRLVVATAGIASSRGALIAAHAIASRHDSHVSVVSVFQPRIPYPAAREGEFPHIPSSDRDPARHQLSAVRQQISTLGVDSERWSLSFVAGQPAHNINQLARAQGADLLVIGLGRENAAERGLGDRGSMAIAGGVHCPLLAVAPTCPGVFQDVLIAVGADDSALTAFRLAQALLPAPRRLHLVHVAEPHAGAAEAATQRRIDELLASLTSWESAIVECWSLNGELIDQLLDFARAHGIDLVIGGLHGGTFAERAIMRNAALWLMALGDRSVLLVPAGGATL
jgi:nucleotide-binding universal stress UspA family protein